VVEADCLQLAKRLHDESGVTPCVLNMANQFIVGGDYLSCQGQEESIIRRTDLLDSLKALDGVVEGNLTNPWLYAFEDTLGFSDEVQRGGFGEFTCLYSPGVTVNDLQDPFFYSEDEKKVIEPFTINVLSSAAYNLVEDARPDRPAYIAGTVFKILNQLRTAREHGQRTLILGAFGCGAFQNDPEMVAQIYRSALQEYEFRGCFDEIYFSIRSTSLSHNVNYETFSAEFNRPFAPALIRDLLSCEVSDTRKSSDPVLKTLMDATRGIHSVQELYFLIERKTRSELNAIQGSKLPLNRARKDFLRNLLERISEEPDKVAAIVTECIQGPEFSKLTPVVGIFSHHPYGFGAVLQRLINDAGHLIYNDLEVQEDVVLRALSGTKL